MFIRKLPWMLGFSLALLCGTGCGNYTITFDLSDVINAYGDDNTRTALDVDIVCLSPKEADKYPEIINKTMTSDEWFRLRSEKSARLANIDPAHIYALRAGDKSANDELKGPPLQSPRDTRDKATSVTVKGISHSSYTNGKSAIVIYAAFGSREGPAKVAPIVLQPPPQWAKGNQLHIRVDRIGMALVEEK